MKFNKWTLGLAAVGAVSMASAVRADEAKLSQVQTALSNTTISGFVDVAVQYNMGNQSTSGNLPPYANNGFGNVISSDANTGIRDGFSLNAVDVAINKPLDDSPWAAGYCVEFNAGTGAINGVPSGHNIVDGNVSGGTSLGLLAIRQAYITMRTPLGNGIDWKLGVMDGITGYESNTGYANPNYTRSYGYIINPTSYTGLLGTYKIIDGISITGGIINIGTTLGFDSNGYSLNSKNFVGAITLTAPESWGWLKGSAINGQTIQSFDNNGVITYSASATLATPVAGLKVGLAFDALQSTSEGAPEAHGNVYGVYATYDATDKLHFALRGELVDADGLMNNESGEDDPFNTLGTGTKIEEVTATVQYDLWANVVSRAEFRWDHAENFHIYGSNTANDEPGTQDAFLIALNVVYKF